MTKGRSWTVAWGWACGRAMEAAVAKTGGPRGVDVDPAGAVA